jgi:AsmA family protein
VSNATGRQLLINGDLKIDLGWISRVRASQIQFENAQWGKHPQMVEVGLFDVQVDLLQLLSKFRVVLPTVTISQPKVIKDGTFLFDDQETKNLLELKLTQAEAAGFLEEPVKLKAEGTYQKLPLTVSLDGGSYQNLRSTQESYPLRINLGMGKVKAKIDGNLTDPLAMRGEDVTLDIQGDDMANLFPLIRLVFPSTPPYRLKGHLNTKAKSGHFQTFPDGSAVAIYPATSGLTRN